MSQATTYQCPNCTGVMRFDVASGALVCDYCGQAFAEGEYEKAIPIGGAPVEAAATEHVTTVEGFLEHAPWQVGSSDYANAVTYACPSCGAAVVADQSTVSTACPYCGNNMLVQGIATAENIPSHVLPFSITREQAMRCLHDHFKHKWYLSRKFSAEVEHLQGIYVPYHLFNLHVHGWADYLGNNEKTDPEGNVVTIGYKALHRAGYLDAAQLPVDASSKMPDSHMDAIAPFDFAKMRAFSASYVAGYLAEVADESAEMCLPRAETLVRDEFENQLASDARKVPKVDSVDRIAGETQVDVTSVSTCVLPVWLMHCSWEGSQMLFAVNGDTGKCVGDLPIDRMRRIVTLVVAFAIALAFDWPLIVELFTSDDMPDIMYGIAGLILVIPFIFDMHFKSQMRTASEPDTFDRKLSEEGLVVTETWDAPKFHLTSKKALADLET